MKLHRSLLIAATVFFLATRMAMACEEIKCEDNQSDEAVYASCLAEKKSCLETKLAEVKAQKSTLSSTIAVVSGKIALQELSITQTLSEITKLENDIELLGDRITTLDLSLDQLTTMLLKRVRERYKTTATNPLLLLASSRTFSEAVSTSRYVGQAGQQTAIIMRQAEIQKQLFDVQKDKKKQAQDLLEQKRALIEQQRRELASQKAAQQTLLEVTKNDEKKYQQLLASAQAEIAALRNFSSSKTGGTLPAQNSPDGWFFSQRDERWAGFKIGNSSEIIEEVGCLISSTAMIKKKMGEDINPISIAANNSYFFGNTAYMLQPWPAPSGYYYSTASYSQSLLDQKLSENPVIIKLSAGPYGTHFIVMKEKSGSDYIIHDPWEGYDKKFADFYTTGQIISISYLIKK